jgi:FixJ family two-component response regulator
MPDIIISDMRMPEMDGLQFLEALKEIGMPCPVIILTGFADIASIRKSWRLGAFDFLDKPVAKKTLLETIHRALVFGKSNKIPA